jgi:RNA polymerase sigma factor (sigma-70 family)
MVNEDIDQLAAKAAIDQKAFRKIYDEVYPSVYHFFRRTFGSESAPDYTQILFQKLYQALSQYQPSKGHFRAWVYRMTRNVAIDALRASNSSPRNENIDDFEIQEVKYISQEERISLQQIKDKLRDLPPQMRRIMQMKYSWNLSNKEIAEELGIEERSVSSQSARALEKLSLWFSQKGGQDAT